MDLSLEGDDAPILWREIFELGIDSESLPEPLVGRAWTAISDYCKGKDADEVCGDAALTAYTLLYAKSEWRRKTLQDALAPEVRDADALLWTRLTQKASSLLEQANSAPGAERRRAIARQVRDKLRELVKEGTDGLPARLVCVNIHPRKNEEGFFDNRYGLPCWAASGQQPWWKRMPRRSLEEALPGMPSIDPDRRGTKGLFDYKAILPDFLAAVIEIYDAPMKLKELADAVDARLPLDSAPRPAVEQVAGEIGSDIEQAALKSEFEELADLARLNEKQRAVYRLRLSQLLLKEPRRTNSQIAKELGISMRTVDNRKAEIRRAILRLANRNGKLARIASHFDGRW